MRKATALSCIIAASLAVSQAAFADAIRDSEKGSFAPSVQPLTAGAAFKSASANSLGARSTVTLSATAYGGFSLAQQATVYVLVRGNSLGSLGVTQAYLDLPRLRLFDSAGNDLISDNAGRAGFNRCVASTDAAVINFYAARGAPVNSNDACIGAVFSAGTYTFTVTPTNFSNLQSSPLSGEILFEVMLGP